MLAVSGWLVMWADSATPNPIKMRQPDGSTITLRLHGDEFCSWYTSEDGRTIYKRGADGWWRADSGGGPNRAMRTAAREQRAARDADIRGARKSKVGWGERHFLVILVQWSDQPFQSGFGDYFTRALNEPGFSDFGSVGSARDYYLDASQLQFQPVFDMVGPVTLSRKHNEWPDGDNNSHHYEMARVMVREAVAKLDSEIDFSVYDIDKDGYIDGIYMVYPGYAQSNGGGEDTIWPHKSTAYSSDTFDGVKIGTYACSSELLGNSGTDKCGIGTFCHEFGHVVGLPDLYDTDYEVNGQAIHPGPWNLMAGGNHNANGRIPARMSLMERYILGYVTDVHDLNSAGQVTLHNLDSPAFYRIPTTNEGEYFLPEVRDGSGYDSTLPAGMIIYHVDRSQNVIDGMTAAERWENWSLINGYEYHPCHYLEIPDKTLMPYGYPMDGDYKNSFHSLWVFPSNSDWNVSYDVTDYDLKAWDGSQPFSLHGIKYAAGEASFTMTRGSRTVTGVVTDSQTGAPVQGAVVFLEAKTSSAPARVMPMRPSAARSSASYEVETDYDGQFLIELPEDFSQQLLLSVFATDYQPAHADLSGWSVRKDIQLDPVISGGTDVGLTKAIFPLSTYLKWGYNTTTDYTVAVRYTAEEMKAYVDGTISAISFSTLASGQEVWVFVDYGTKKRAFARRVTGSINTKVQANQPSNQVDISDANVKIPAGTDIYVGYLIKQSNANIPVVTDNNKADPREGGTMFYHGFSTTATPGESGWQDVNFSGSVIGDALIAFTVKSPLHITPGTTLTDLGINYIDLPSGTLASGQKLPLKLVSSPTEKPSGVQWFYDGVPVGGESVVLTAGSHILMVRLQYADGREDKVESQIVVQ